jgi:2-(1,2-epoxy-1,2-dihydrophenyl)acetyl-CoA isomerase
MDYTTLRFELRDGVARVTLNRPEAHNAMNLAMVRELYDAIRRCDDDPAVRAVLLTGTGKAFCAGGDLRSFSATGAEIGAHVKDVTTALHDAISRMARMDAPVIAAVNGAAAGGGMALACACDLIVAGESARFTMAYTRAGLTPDGSSTFYLPRLVGLGRALDLALTNRMLSAAGATAALGGAKRLLTSGWNETLETQMARESRRIARAAEGAEAREGIAAFLEKRPPRFE